LARIASDGLIGSRIVVLSGGTAEATKLAAGDELEIGASLSMDDVLAVAQENNKNLLVITQDLRGLTGKISRGEGTVGKLLQDDALYTRLDETILDLRATSESARGIASDFAGIAHAAARPGSFVHDLSTDRTTYASVTASATGLQQTSERAAKLVDDVAAKVNHPDTPVGALLGDEAMGKDLQVTVAQLRTSSGLLAEDLEALQHNFLLRRYFRKQARAERDAASDATVQK
jgi:phospholipid/cholesterol/gamma-HCH transport system substrate-binding protein